ncbi:MAG TPA: nitroreductase family protein [Acidimicrobiales bacterium]|nr:nitroreductase family protein [Acidimicrobiales bacterium]
MDEVPDLLTGMATTRAIRRYRDEPIPEQDLATILWHATRAPSGSNRQSFRFLVLRDGPAATEARRLLGESFRALWAQKRQRDGYDEGTGAAAGSPKARMADTMQRFVDRFEETPVVVLACLRRHRPPTPTEGASIYPACQNLLLAARALGYGGVLTMWHQHVEAELRAVLGIPGEVAISATIALGRPEGSHGPVRRRPVQELVYEDRWEAPTPWAQDPPGTRFTSAGPPLAGSPAPRR